ncbi:MAG: accessory factor UbiK family protein [Gammaproteobacteria bacterium]
MNTNTVSDLAKKLAEAVPGSPGGVDTMRADLERNFRGLLDSAFERMELVTREEFDVQRKVLERTREKLATLEAQIANMEKESGHGA